MFLSLKNIMQHVIENIASSGSMIKEYSSDYELITDPAGINSCKWHEFISNHPRGNFFQTREFYNSLKASKYYDAIVIALQDSHTNQLIGIVVAAIQKDYKGLLGKLTKRAIVFGEPLVCNDDLKLKIALIKAVEQNIKTVFTQYRFFSPISTELSNYFLANKYFYEPYLNAIIDTSLCEESLWHNIKRGKRSGIHKGQKQGFVFYLNENFSKVDTFYSLLTDTYNHAKVPFPKKDYFEALKNNVPSSVLKVFELKDQGKIIITLVSFLYKDTLYAHYIGIYHDKDILRKHPVDYFYWELLKWCCNNGIKYFDWMGAGNKNKDYGVRNYKQSFVKNLVETGRMSKYNNLFVKLTSKTLLNWWKKLK